MFKMKSKIYLDNGATTKIDDEVIKVMNNYFKKIYGNASSLHDYGDLAKQHLEKARKTFANYINALPEEIIFTSGGTESDNLAIKGIAYSKGKGHIITSKIEHPAVLNTCKQLEKEGFEITYLNVDNNGTISLNELKKSIKKETILITIMHANNEIGTIQPIKEIGEIAKQNQILFHSDAVQSFTKIDIDVKEINIDLISFSSHKIYGPKGVGALFVKKGITIKPLFNGGSHEFRKRAGTENISGIIGFLEAIKLNKKLKQIEKLRNKLIKGLLKIPHTKLNGHPIQRLVNNVNISFNYVEGESILYSLNEEGIAVSTGSACSSNSLDPSHVLLAIGLKHEEAHGAIRFTLSKYTTTEEIEYTIKTVEKVIKRLRAMSPVGDEL